MSRRVTILGTNHLFQGCSKHPRIVIDPLYRSLVASLIASDKVDFVFEEATGFGPTIAEEIAESMLGNGHYLDVDPMAEREAHGVGGPTARLEQLYEIPKGEVPAYCCEFIVAGQKTREALWLEAMEATEFKSGLLICGLAHLLSMAFRLEASGYSVTAKLYNPEHRLCERTHDVPIPGLILRLDGSDKFL